MYGITLKDVTLQSNPNPRTDRTVLKLIHNPSGVYVTREANIIDDNQLTEIVKEMQEQLEPKIGENPKLSQEERDMVFDNIEWITSRFGIPESDWVVSNYVCGLMEGRFSLDQGIRQIYADNRNDDVFDVRNEDESDL